MSFEQKNNFCTDLPRGFDGIWIPKEIWLEPDLTALEKMLWAEIRSLGRHESGCFASNAYFAKFFGTTERRIQQMLAKLKKKNLIVNPGFDGRKRILRALNPKEPFHGRGEINFTPDLKYISPIEQSLEGVDVIGRTMPNKVPLGTDNAIPKPKKAGIGKAVSDACASKDPARPKRPQSNRKHPRKREEEDAYQWLLSLVLTDENGETNTDAMSFLAHTYSRQQLEDAFTYMTHREQVQKKQPKSQIAVFRAILKNESSQAGKNVAFAKAFSHQNHWTSLKIKPMYVLDESFPDWDLPLDMNPEEFAQALENKYYKNNRN